MIMKGSWIAILTVLTNLVDKHAQQTIEYFQSVDDAESDRGDGHDRRQSGANGISPGQIEDRGGAYVLAVKANQPELHEDIRTFLDDAISWEFQGIQHDRYEQTEKGHGRIEIGRCWTTSHFEWLRQRHEWPGLQSIAAVECHRQIGDLINLIGTVRGFSG